MLSVKHRDKLKPMTGSKQRAMRNDWGHHILLLQMVQRQEGYGIELERGKENPN